MNLNALFLISVGMVIGAGCMAFVAGWKRTVLVLTLIQAAFVVLGMFAGYVP
jgi:hypothetical protein